MTKEKPLDEILEGEKVEKDTRMPFKKYFGGLDLNIFSEPQESLKKIEQAMEIYPERRMYMLKKLAEVYERLDQPEKAAEIYEEAIPLRKEHKFMEGYIDDYLLGAAENYFLIWEFDKAEDLLKEAIKEYPKKLANYRNLSDFYRRREKFDVNELDKFPEYETSTTKKPEKDLDKAANILKVALRRVPEEEWGEWDKRFVKDIIYTHLVDVYTDADIGGYAINNAKSLVEVAENELEKKKQDQKRYPDIDFDTHSETNNLIESLRILGKTQIKFENEKQGIEAYEKAHSLLNPPHDIDFYDLGRAYLKCEMVDQAEDQFRSSVRGDLRDIGLRDVASAHFKNKDYEKAAKIWEEYGDPTDILGGSTAYYNAGVAYYNDMDYRNAKRIFNDILRRGVKYKEEAQEMLDKIR